MKGIRRFIGMVLFFFLPVRVSFWLLNLLGHKIHSKAKIGFSIIWLDGTLTLHKHSKIGNFNIIRTNDITIHTAGYIGNYNKLVGPFKIILLEKGAIGNGNKCYRPPLGSVAYGDSILELGFLSKITANHRVDCTRSVQIGNYTTVAGHDSQLWTHAYYHDQTGPGRFRVDGDIKIGNNVYIGSRCIINGGISIADNVVVGANACISKSLLKAGLYVNQPLRHIDVNENEDLRSKFKRIDGFPTLEDEVYQR